MKMTEAYTIIQEFALILKSPEPEDLANDVAIKVLKKPEILNKTEKQIRNYLFIITRNKHLDNCRKKKHQVELPHDLAVEQRESKIDHLIKLASLTELEAMWLDAYMDMGDISKISRKLGVDRTDVSKRMNQIFRKCRPYKHLL